MTDQPTRQTAYKCWISSLIKGRYIKQEGKWEPNYIQTEKEKVSRVNIIANVVMKYKSEDGNYVSVVLDDGSDTIRVKTWREDTALLKNIETGDMVMIIGRPREYQDEIYITPEIVKQIENPNWELVRKLELIKKYGRPNAQQHLIEEEPQIERNKEEIDVPVTEEIIEEEIVEDIKEQPTETLRQKILNIIEKVEEVDIQTLIKETNIPESEVESLIQELLKEGEIYESRPGILKVI